MRNSVLSEPIPSTCMRLPDAKITSISFQEEYTSNPPWMASTLKSDCAFKWSCPPRNSMEASVLFKTTSPEEKTIFPPGRSTTFPSTWSVPPSRFKVELFSRMSCPFGWMNSVPLFWRLMVVVCWTCSEAFTVPVESPIWSLPLPWMSMLPCPQSMPVSMFISSPGKTRLFREEWLSPSAPMLTTELFSMVVEGRTCKPEFPKLKFDPFSMFILKTECPFGSSSANTSCARKARFA